MAYKKYIVKWTLIHNGKVYEPGEHSLNLTKDDEKKLVKLGVIEFKEGTEEENSEEGE